MGTLGIPMRFGRWLSCPRQQDAVHLNLKDIGSRLLSRPPDTSHRTGHAPTSAGIPRNGTRLPEALRSAINSPRSAIRDDLPPQIVFGRRLIRVLVQPPTARTASTTTTTATPTPDYLDRLTSPSSHPSALPSHAQSFLHEHHARHARFSSRRGRIRLGRLPVGRDSARPFTTGARGHHSCGSASRGSAAWARPWRSV